MISVNGNQTFQGYNCDLSQLQKSVGVYFAGKNYKTTNFRMDKRYLTTAYKTQMGNKILAIIIQGTPQAFEVSFGLTERVTDIHSIQPLEKIPLDVKMLLADPLVERNFISYISTQAELKRNTQGLYGDHAIIPPSQPLIAPLWRERETIREIEVVYCRYCGTKNNARLSTCAKCNAGLH